jgi:hypothetical protein
MQEITCTHNNTFLIYTDKVQGQDVVVIDMNIKKYKNCNDKMKTGWQDIEFPSNVMIKDKIYLNESLKNEVVLILKQFIKEGYFNHDKIQQTERGFDYLNLKDIDGKEISVQNSSAATLDAIWFGGRVDNVMIKKENGDIEPFTFPEGAILLGERLHLTKSLARQLIKSINDEWNAYMFHEKLDQSLETKNKTTNIRKM